MRNYADAEKLHYDSKGVYATAKSKVFPPLCNYATTESKVFLPLRNYATTKSEVFPPLRKSQMAKIETFVIHIYKVRMKIGWNVNFRKLYIHIYKECETLWNGLLF